MFKLMCILCTIINANVFQEVDDEESRGMRIWRKGGRELFGNSSACVRRAA